MQPARDPAEQTTFCDSRKVRQLRLGVGYDSDDLRDFTDSYAEHILEV